MITKLTFGETPAWSSQVAAVWREPWKVIGTGPSSVHFFVIQRRTAFRSAVPDLSTARWGLKIGPDSGCVLDVAVQAGRPCRGLRGRPERRLLLEPSRNPLKIAADPWFEEGESE
jgi:hypothetical protein